MLVPFLRLSSYVTDGDEPAKALETKKDDRFITLGFQARTVLTAPGFKRLYLKTKSSQKLGLRGARLVEIDDSTGTLGAQIQLNPCVCRLQLLVTLGLQCCMPLLLPQSNVTCENLRWYFGFSAAVGFKLVRPRARSSCVFL